MKQSLPFPLLPAPGSRQFASVSTRVHSNTIHNSQKVATTQMPFSGRKERHNMVYAVYPIWLL